MLVTPFWKIIEAHAQSFARSSLAMADKENERAVKKRRLSLSLKENRFRKVSEKDVSCAQKGFVPGNTCSLQQVGNQ